MLGGTQSLHTNSFDEAIALPTDFSRADRPQHAADPGRGKRRHRGRRSARRQLVCRGADPRAGGESLGADRGGRGAWRHDQGGRRRPAQAPHRGSRGGARGQGRYRRDGDRRGQPLPAGRGRGASTSSRSTTPRCAAGQIARIEKMRAARDEAKARAALDALGSRARAATRICSTLSVEAARVRVHARRNLGRAGARVRALRHHARAGARDLRQGARRRALEGGGRGHAARSPTPRPQAPHHGRQDGPGRARPRRQSGVVGLHRSGLRSRSPGPCSRPRARRREMAVEKDVDVVGAARSRRATRR